MAKHNQTDASMHLDDDIVIVVVIHYDDLSQLSVCWSKQANLDFVVISVSLHYLSDRCVKVISVALPSHGAHVTQQ